MKKKKATPSPFFNAHSLIEKLVQDRNGEKPTIVLGLSGGPDSVFLFHALLALSQQGTINLIVAHLNHGWRNAADADEQFCKHLATQHAIPFHAAHAQDFEDQVKKNGSQEEYGRNLRRVFFEKLLGDCTADYIALGHHKQDVEETFFIRLVRGSTLTGLVGMKEIDGHYIRPLLKNSKDELLAYLRENNLEYCIDESNASDGFLRNRIRNHVLPALRAADDRFPEKFDDTLTHIRSSENYLQRLTTQAFENVFDAHSEGKPTGNLKAFLNLDAFLMKRVLVAWLTASGKTFTLSSRYLDEIIRFLDSPRGGQHHIGAHLIIKKQRGSFWLS